MLDGIRFGLHCVRHVARVAGMHGQREALCVRFLRDRREEGSVEAVEHTRGSSGFQNRLDASDAVGFERIHLLTGFLGGLGDSVELLQQCVAGGLRYLLEVFRTVAACRGEERAAGLDFRAQTFAAGHGGANLEDAVQNIPGAADRGHAAVEISREVVQQHLVRIVVLLVILLTGGLTSGKSAHCAQMHVHVDEARQNRFAGGSHDFGLQGLGIGAVPFIDAGNLAAANQDAAVFDDLAIANENTGAANQVGITTGKLAGQDFVFLNGSAMVSFPCSQNEKWQDDHAQPQLRSGTHLFIFLPAKQLERNEKADNRGD